MRILALTVAAVGTAMLSGCATDTASRTTTAQTGPSTPIPVTPAAKPASSCVQLSRIREAKVVDDRTIDFILNDRTVLRNTLPYACPQLGFERAFTYSTSLSQLCSVDIITVLATGGGVRRGASCGLGPFAAYTPVPAAK